MTIFAGCDNVPMFDTGPDVVELPAVDAPTLAEVVALIEAERDRIKAYNATCRKGAMDETLLDDRQRAQLESVRRHTPYTLGKRGEMPGYALSNLSGNIGKQRARLADLQRKAVTP